MRWWIQEAARWSFVLAVSIPLLSCGEDEGSSTGDVTGLPAGDYELRWDGDAQVLEVARRD
ncbi:MAG: hypothetical protein ACODAU_12885, partial [Myxococcota bacterium]